MRSPTLRARLLGQQLRMLREEAHLTLREVGDYVQRDPSTVSRFESGLVPARVPEVLAYLDLCGVTDADRRDALKRLSQDVFQKGWWDRYANDIAAWLVDRILLEARAEKIYSFQAVVLPGLLQTADYAEAVIRASEPDASPRQVARWVEVRMNRQQLLSGRAPVHLEVILDEAAVRRLVGGLKTMRAQLEHLLAVARETQVELMVLPAVAGAHASPSGAFEVFTMRPPYSDVGYVETPTGDVCLEATSTVTRLRSAYGRLREAAYGPTEAIRFIERLTEKTSQR